MILDIIASILVLAGSFFCIVGGIGLLRMPDFYTRIHAAAITDTLGAALVIVGLMVAAGISLVSVKLLMIIAFLWITSPAGAHALGKAALKVGPKPMLDGDEP